MKKIFLFLFGILSFIFKGQDQINFGDFQKPLPSVSYLSKYTESPVSISTGIPQINIPLFSFKTNNDKISINYSLDYHVGNGFDFEVPASDVGTGWSLIGNGVISRKINGEVDEIYDNAGAQYYMKNEFDDEYYYNLPNGKAGKFKFKRDIVNNTFSVVELSGNKLKIEYTRDDTNTATLILNKFKIIDDDGMQYVFDDYTLSSTSVDILTIKYKSSFNLTKILDPNNIELVSYTYQKNTKYGIRNVIIYQNSKLNKIKISNKAFIELNYDYHEDLEDSPNDPYSLNSIIIKNYANVLQYSYNFVYSIYDFTNPYSNTVFSKRILNSVIKKNKNNQQVDVYSIQYQQNTDSIPGMLKRITYPSKGAVEYNFESNQTYINKEDPSFLYYYRDRYVDSEIQYLKSTNLINYDTNNNNKYTFIVPNDINDKRTVYVDFKIDEYYPAPEDPFRDPGCSYVDENGQTVLDPNCSNPTPNIPESTVNFVLKQGNEVIDGYKFLGHQYTEFYLFPGSYTLEITGTGGKGTVLAYEGRLKDPPYNNNIPSNGYRIATIKTYENQNDAIAKKTVTYNYSDFINPLNTSGYKYLNENDTNGTNSLTAYKNVKVTEGANAGYKKYYFKSPDEFSKLNITIDNKQEIYWPFYGLSSSGIIDKLEIYDNNDNINSSTNYTYTFEESPNVDYYKIFNGYFSKPSYIKYDKQTTQQYGANSSNYLTSSIENNYNTANFKVSSSKELSPDGTITEMFVKYAGDKSLQSLINANMISVPLETEIKKNNKTIGKTETKYENSTNLFPSSVVSINPNDSSIKTTIKYDSYDANGNLVQYTTDYNTTNSLGNPVTIIWGYNKSLPIAKIEGAKLSDIGTLADDIITKSNADIDAATESALLSALDTFRNETTLKNYLITTYTYDPLIGITTVTPPNGMREIYKYDVSNRLEFVVDSNGNIIKQMKYNTKQ